MISYGQTVQDPGFALRPNLLAWLGSKPRFAFDKSITTPAAQRAWQKRARKQFEHCLGDPIEPVAPRPRIMATEQMEGYKRITLSLATAPKLRTLAWLLLPDGASKASPLPAMVATPGHGMGGKDLIAMDTQGQPREQGKGYQKDYALQAMQWGAAVLVVEPLGFGERRDQEMILDKSIETGCQAATTIAMMLGTTLAQIRINDLRRALDYLQTRPEVQANRIGIMGISGGGQMSLWASALEDRFKLAVVSGYLNTFRDSVLAMYHCSCNFVPGLARDFDMTDIAMMGATKPMLFESGTQDDIFPIKASRSAVNRLKGYYKKLGCAGRIESDVFEGEHQWSGRKLAGFLDQYL